MLILYLMDNEWARRFFAALVIVLAYFVTSYLMKKRRKKEDDSGLILDAYTRQPWNLEKMALPNSGHGLAESLSSEMHAELTLNKDRTFEAKCPINTFTGTWCPPVCVEGAEAEPCTCTIEQTTAILGNDVVLRLEESFVRMFKNTYDMKIAHGNTHLTLRTEDDRVIGMFKLKPADRQVRFTK